uniref:Uncharacterized protein n=1 Tax=Equus asinus TaxID=9793 RepID=A0A9L0K361_EQUAS
MSYKSIALNLSSSPSPAPLVSHRHQWDSVPGGTACFGPVFKDFGPPSLGYVQVTKTLSIQDSQGTYRDLLLETGKEIWPAYAKKRHHPCLRRLSPSCLVSWAIAILCSACLLLNMFS